MNSLPLKKSNSGQGLVEYALIIAIVVLAVILVVEFFGEANKRTYGSIISALQGQKNPETPEDPSPEETKEPIFNQTACENEVVDLKNWKTTTTGKKDWSTDGSSLCVENNKAQENYAFSECSMKNLPTNYEVELKNAYLSSGDGINLMFRLQKYTQKPDGYSFAYEPTSSSFILYKWVKGSPTPIASTVVSGYSQYQISHTIKIQVVGSAINAYVDGKLVLSAQDNTYNSGGVGVQVVGDDGSACFNDLIVRAETP